MSARAPAGANRNAAYGLRRKPRIDRRRRSSPPPYLQVYHKDMVQGPIITICIIVLMLSRFFRKGEGGKVTYIARESDVGYMYLMLCGVAFFFGLRFTSSIIVAIVLSVLFGLTVVTSESGSGKDEYGEYERFQVGVSRQRAADSGQPHIEQHH